MIPFFLVQNANKVLFRIGAIFSRGKSCCLILLEVSVDFLIHFDPSDFREREVDGGLHVVSLFLGRYVAPLVQPYSQLPLVVRRTQQLLRFLHHSAPLSCVWILPIRWIKYNQRCRVFPPAEPERRLSLGIHLKTRSDLPVVEGLVESGLQRLDGVTWLAKEIGCSSELLHLLLLELRGQLLVEASQHALLREHDFLLGLLLFTLFLLRWRDVAVGEVFNEVYDYAIFEGTLGV